MNQPQSRPSDLYLERYLLGELPSDEKADMQQRLATDPELAKRLHELETQDKAFKSSHPASLWVPRIEQALEKKANQTTALPDSPPPIQRQAPKREWSSRGRSARDGYRREWQWAMGFAGVMALALTTMPMWMANQQDAGDTVRLKGKTLDDSVGLSLYRQTPDGPEALQPGEMVKPGDALQIELHAGAYPFASVVSVDGRGAISWHWPVEGSPSHVSPLHVSHLVKGRLPNAFQLDSAPGFERFYLLLAQDSLSLADRKRFEPRLSESHRHEPEWFIQHGLVGEASRNLVIKGFPLRKMP